MTYGGMMSATEDEKSVEAPKPSTTGSSYKRIIQIIILSLLVWSAVGIIVYPEWWYSLVYDSQYRSIDYWTSGNLIATYNVIGYLFPSALIVWAILSFSGQQAHQRLVRANRRMALLVTNPLGYSVVVVLLIVAFLIGLHFTGPRTQASRDIQASLEKSKRDLEAIRAKISPAEVPPLTDPTSFTYIDPAEIESLYGQNEPELVPTLVKKRIEDSRKVDLSFGAGDSAKADVGSSELQAEEQELKATEKNPQRKLKDLIDFLYEQKKLKRYGLDRPLPDELKKLDDATALLSGYGVIADEKNLRGVRDRLFAEELNRLETELSTIHGLVLVDGDWTVEKGTDGYTFRAPVIEHISSPLSFEFHLSDSEIQAKTKEIIEKFRSRRIRLSAFGNVIAGASSNDQNVHIMPIAVY
jgi:hypothetical protein